jgi:hypothetical protein
MAEPRTHHDGPEHYDETRNPRNPPNSVLQPEVRRATTRSFLLPLVVLAVIAGILWVVFAGQSPRNRDARDNDVPTMQGTSGQDEPGKGGVNPDPKADDTKDEVEFRGGKN